MVKNYMEYLVDLYFTDVFTGNRSFDTVCRCEKCSDDIRAMALNNLKPYYVTSKKGEIFAEYANLQTQYKADVYGSLTRAIEFVSKNKKCLKK